MPKGKPNNEGIERAIAYVHGRIEVYIEQYAHALAIDSFTLSTRIAELLSSQGPGVVNSMPTLRSGSAQNSRGLEPLALAVNAHSNGASIKAGGKTGKKAKKVRQLSEAGRKAISDAMKKRWAAKGAGKKPKPAKKKALHWTQTPEGRKKIAANNKRMWAARKAAS